uniref:SGNH hydrolase-type esterase domain-containing protein n=1 Tax=Sphaeramia orbicularis TaxID=375764 RepID=A0A672ZD33_9TELE
GYRHAVQKWPPSPFTGRSHKLVIPAESPDKKFVLIVGDSHLRAIVDGFVQMPGGWMSFGFMSTPGTSAAQLRTEVENAVLPRIPEAVCLLAPGNDVTASRTIEDAAEDFRGLLRTVSEPGCSVKQQFIFICYVCVLDFPRRLTVEMEHQVLLSQEYHRVAALMRIPYLATDVHFPLGQLQLWCWDGVSKICYCRSLMYGLLSLPPVPRRSPRVVVRGEVTVPLHSNPFEWTVAGPRKKGNVVLKECSVELNPIWFSRELLDVLGDGTIHVPAPVSTAVVAHQKVNWMI